VGVLLDTSFSSLFSSQKNNIFSYSQRLTAVATKKHTIGDCQYHGLKTLVKSASTVPLNGLLPKGAKLCHTSNILLVGRQCHRALLWLYFNFSLAGWLSVAS
jgi:hypothetical protein